MSDWINAQHEAIGERIAALRAVADPECKTCKGIGTTQGYIGPGKHATYACPCTGQADYQRNDLKREANK